MEFDRKSRESFYTAMNEPLDVVSYGLKLTKRDVGSTFKDGWGIEWKILDFNPSEEYGVYAAATDITCTYVEFDQFGKRKYCEKKPRHSLNFGYAESATQLHEERPLILL